MFVIKPLRNAQNRDFTFLLGGSDIRDIRSEHLPGDAYVENHRIGPDYVPYVLDGGQILLSSDGKAPTRAWTARAEHDDNFQLSSFFLNPMVIDRLEEKRGYVEVRYENAQGSKIYVANCCFVPMPNEHEACQLYGTNIANMMKFFHLLA